MSLAQALGSEGEKEVGVLSGRSGSCKIWAGCEPTNHFSFLGGGHRAQARECADFVLPPAAPCPWGEHVEREPPARRYTPQPPFCVPRPAPFGSIFTASYRDGQMLSRESLAVETYLETS